MMILTQSPGKYSEQKTIALLGAFCLFLSALEYLIPKPLPFMRLGLANLPLLLGIDILSFSAYLLLVSIKILGQALISGTFFSYVFLFSLAGTGVSGLAMYGLRRFLTSKRIGLIGTSAAGAMLSNIVQLILAYFFIFGINARYIAPPLLVLGLISGSLLGLFCEIFAQRSRWYAAKQGKEPPGKEEASNRSKKCSMFHLRTGTPSTPVKRRGLSPLIYDHFEKFRIKRQEQYQKLFSAQSLAAAGLVIIPSFIFNQDTGWKTAQFLFFYFLAWMTGKKNNPLVTITVILGIMAVNLLSPYGEILFSLGPLVISKGALLSGFSRGIGLEALIMLSRAAIRKDLRIRGRFGALLGESFRFFGAISERKNFFRGKALALSLDEMLLELDQENMEAGTLPQDGNSANDKPRKTVLWPGLIILIIAVLVSWLFYFMSLT